MITTVINPFDQLVSAAREALAELDEQDALLVEQLRSMAGEAEQRAEQRQRIEASLDALVPVSLPAAPEPLEVAEEPAPAAAAVLPEVHSPAPALAIRQIPADSVVPSRRYCPGCGGAWPSILHREHMDAISASGGQLQRDDAWAPAEGSEAPEANEAPAQEEAAPAPASEEVASVEAAHKHHFMFGNVPDADGVLHGSCSCGQDSSAPVEPENSSKLTSAQRIARAAAAEAAAVPA